MFIVMIDVLIMFVVVVSSVLMKMIVSVRLLCRCLKSSLIVCSRFLVSCDFLSIVFMKMKKGMVSSM